MKLDDQLAIDEEVAKFDPKRPQLLLRPTSRDVARCDGCHRRDAPEPRLTVRTPSKYMCGKHDRAKMKKMPGY